ncbi:MAG: MarR family transcriptional regulator [Leptospiraceae bacterium]|nr:MarR family transcriptional regulator [Leptospiraceae bacterium]
MEKNQILDDSIFYSVHKLNRLLHLHFQKLGRFHGVDLSMEQWFLLVKLFLKEGVSQVELTEKIFNDKPNITRMIDNLEEKFLLQRTNDKNDRRKFLIVLTDKGREIASRMNKIVSAEKKELYRGLKIEEIKVLKNIFSRIEENILSSKLN